MFGEWKVAKQEPVAEVAKELDRQQHYSQHGRDAKHTDPDQDRPIALR